MKQLLFSTALLAAVFSATVIGRASTIVNLDFNGQRGSEPFGGTNNDYLSIGATGTTWNGIAADSAVFAGSPPVFVGNNDALTVGGSSLVDQFGVTTSVGFSIAGVGGDNNANANNPPTDLFSDYIFAYSPAAFTISGLTGATTANLYFYNPANILNIQITGFTPTTGTTGAGLSYLEFDNVTVGIGGLISGTMAGQGLSVLPAMEIQTAAALQVAPEPSTWAMMLGGIGLLMFVRRQRMRLNRSSR